MAGTPPKHEPKNTSPVFPLINAFLQEEAPGECRKAQYSQHVKITIISVYSFIYVFNYLVMDIRTASATATTICRYFQFSACKHRVSFERGSKLHKFLMDIFMSCGSRDFNEIVFLKFFLNFFMHYHQVIVI